MARGTRTRLFLQQRLHGHAVQATLAVEPALRLSGMPVEVEPDALVLRMPALQNLIPGQGRVVPGLVKTEAENHRFIVAGFHRSLPLES